MSGITILVSEIVITSHSLSASHDMGVFIHDTNFYEAIFSIAKIYNNDIACATSIELTRYEPVMNTHTLRSYQ